MFGPQLPEGDRQVFDETVWKIARLIPLGKLSTYGQIAGFIPCPAGFNQETYEAFRARWVGSAMAACPGDVPWQRVINSQGKISQRPGAEHQRALLEAEGVPFSASGKVDLKRCGWAGPDPDWLRGNGLNAPEQDASQPALF